MPQFNSIANGQTLLARNSTVRSTSTWRSQSTAQSAQNASPDRQFSNSISPNKQSTASIVPFLPSLREENIMTRQQRESSPSGLPCQSAVEKTELKHKSPLGPRPMKSAGATDDDPALEERMAKKRNLEGTSRNAVHSDRNSFMRASAGRRSSQRSYGKLSVRSAAASTGRRVKPLTSLLLAKLKASTRSLQVHLCLARQCMPTSTHRVRCPWSNRLHPQNRKLVAVN